MASTSATLLASTLQAEPARGTSIRCGMTNHQAFAYRAVGGFRREPQVVRKGLYKPVTSLIAQICTLPCRHLDLWFPLHAATALTGRQSLAERYTVALESDGRRLRMKGKLRECGLGSISSIANTISIVVVWAAAFTFTAQAAPARGRPIRCGATSAGFNQQMSPIESPSPWHGRWYKLTRNTTFRSYLSHFAPSSIMRNHSFRHGHRLSNGGQSVLSGRHSVAETHGGRSEFGEYLAWSMIAVAPP